jgi:hypothetical protein
MDKIETLLSCRDLYEHLKMESTASYIDDKISEELMRCD